MYSRVFISVIGAVIILCQSRGSSQSASPDCLIIGESSSCNCSKGFTWSNEVCDATKCCRDTTCKQNVSSIAPLCIPKIKVAINGTVKSSTASLDGTAPTKLQTAIEKMNGLESFRITQNRMESLHFEAVVSVKFESYRLQDVVQEVEYGLSAVVWVDTLGMVTINTPGSTVKYRSNAVLNCTYDEATDSAGWNMSRPNQRFELNNGTVVKVNSTCDTGSTYECGFMWRSVRHIAKAHLSVALLPDEISLTIDPLTVDCSESSGTDKRVSVTATIQNSVEHFEVWWSLKGEGENALFNTCGDTVIIRTCPEGRVGYKSRTCDGTTWQPVFFSCVKEELNKVSNAADNFKMGLGATQAVAMDIFGGLKNSSSFSSDSSDATADISASINILGMMAEGSENVALEEDVLDFVDAASNMLNNSWAGVNKSTIHSMSSDYLKSVEGLVKNIRVKNSSMVTSQNLDLQFCSGEDCNVTTFDISVSLNKSSGIMKTVAVKNIMDKLRNNFRKTKPSSLLLSATLEDNKDSSLQIKLDFPTENFNHKTPHCVFWNTTMKDWSDKGCSVKTNDGNYTSCECNHLTSFSVLMAKGDISTDVLDMITNVGLGVSVCSLLIFLIIEFLVWSAVVKTNLSHFRHTAIVNIAVFLLLANCCFLASSFPDKISDTMCLVMTVCKHLFYLAMFSWMLCMSVMLVHQLIFVFSPLRKRVFMFLSSIVGYVCPILIVGCSYVYAKYTNKEYHNRKTCWLVFEQLLEGSIHAFLLPVGTVVLTNLFSMVVVIVTLMKSSVPDSKSDEKDAVKSILKVVVFLTPVFGVTWIIGFFLLILDENDPMFPVANYSFVILNSFQGLFILITGCIAEQKVREELLKLIMAKSKGKSTSTKNFNSTTYTKDK
ncbi:hypothetical protein INR49_004371 [Caranx melampygus]|nr:hypothetical protein INR49_004371 [Caranx melampygus]